MNGIFYNISPEKYHSMPGISKHGLDTLARSPLHFWSAYLDPTREAPKETPALTHGTAIHMCILEPERFQEEYIKEPEIKDYPGVLDKADEYKDQCKKLGLKVTGTKAELEARLFEAGTPATIFWSNLYPQLVENKKILKPAEMYACQKIARSVRSNPTAKHLFSAGQPEVSIFWTDEDTGVECRGRLDWLTKVDTLGHCVVDIKSALNASPEGFGHAVLKHRYWVQAAMYMDALKAVGENPGEFIFAAWEKYPPYASAFYYATPELLEAGRKEYKRLLKTYKTCLETDQWPGYSLNLEPLNLPNYLKIEEEPEEKDWLEEL